jgi:two-component system sensor histidine kinase PhoQ
MRSLSARLLLAMSLLLVVFFGITISLLDLSFRGAAERAIHDRLDVQLMVLLAAADVADDGTVAMPETLPEPRFSTPSSGLFGEIMTPTGERLWRSSSLVGRGLLVSVALERGRAHFERTTTADGEPVFAITMLVDFDLGDDGSTPLVFSVAESLEPFEAEVGRFRGQLFGWFAALTVVLLAAQAVLLRALLRPLRRVEREIVEIEDGVRSELGGEYPTELRGVTKNLNDLIAGERARLERYRNTLGNLAHSLKTPLAVLRANLEKGAPDRAALAPQVERMNDIVSYQLQRAAAWGGGATLGRAPIDVARVIPQITSALRKVYAHKPVQVTEEVAADACFFGEEGDLMEIAGNLLDNAFKWSRGRVSVRASSLDRGGAQRRRGLALVVEDDGPGIAEADRARVLERGVRVDESTPGHGIGLAVVHDLVRLHGGDVAITRSELGGTRVEVRLPPG